MRDKPPHGTCRAKERRREVHDMKDMRVTQLALHLDATTPSTELHISITVVTTLERAFNLDTMFLSKDGERRTESRKVQSRHFLIELFQQEVGIVL